MSDTLEQIKHIARTFMASKGMPSLVINAPEDGDDSWRVYPSGQPAIGIGRTLEEAVADAMTHPQMKPSMSEHTKEPWTHGYTDGSGAELICSGNNAVAAVRWGCGCCMTRPDSAADLNPAERANSARIVSCVNALAGIKDPSAFVAAHKALVEAAKAIMPHIPTENDMLNYAATNDGRCGQYHLAFNNFRLALTAVAGAEGTKGAG